ncbi:MAG: 4-alpha-glucanotransferase [Pseudomonadota bacterium]
MADPLVALAAAMGIDAAYKGVDGKLREVPPETLRALLAAMEVPAETPAEAQARLKDLKHEHAERVLAPYYVLTAETPSDLGLSDWQVTTETGAHLEGRGPLPALPNGIHWLSVGETRAPLLSAPDTLPLPARSWGLTVPLWGLKGAGQAGIGDTRDLGDWAEALAPLGASFLGLNPVHAGFPTDPSAYSPYTPSHRRRWNLLHIPTGDSGGAPGPLIDYATEIPAKLAALRAQHAAEPHAADFAAWRADQGAGLESFATYQALAERQTATWDTWPDALRDPASGAVQHAARELAAEIDFYAWTQWRAETELARAQARARQAGLLYGLYLDLAVGTHPHGAETWEDRESFARGVSLGAPPDAFSPEGQTWGLAPFSPARLIATGFQALAETLRVQLRHARMLRIDHILGFQRAFWVPQNSTAGGYVTMPLDAMLAVARIEACRAGAVLIGEDLGNVPGGLRRDLKASGLLGCQVAMFDAPNEQTPDMTPDMTPDLRLLSFSTHDLPTWRGWRGAADIEARRAIGLVSAPEAARLSEARHKEVAKFDQTLAPGADPEASTALHETLAAQPAQMLAVQVENLLEIRDQPNLPGVVEAYPNWRQRLPEGALSRVAGAKDLSDVMRAAGRSPEIEERMSAK